MVVRCSEAATTDAVLKQSPLVEALVCDMHKLEMTMRPFVWQWDQYQQAIAILMGDDLPWRIQDLEFVTDGESESGPGTALTFHVHRGDDVRAFTIWLTPTDASRMIPALRLIESDGDAVS